MSREHDPRPTAADTSVRRNAPDRDADGLGALRAWLDRPPCIDAATARRRIDQAIDRDPVTRRPPISRIRSGRSWAAALAVAALLAAALTIAFRAGTPTPPSADSRAGAPIGTTVASTRPAPDATPASSALAASTVIVELRSGSLLYLPLDRVPAGDAFLVRHPTRHLETP